MRKRDRSASASPAISPLPPLEETQTQPAHQRVLFDVLRRTSLAEQKDREILDWLTETAAWLQDSEYAQVGAGAQAELRFLVLGVLRTMPWWRVVAAVDPQRAKAAMGANRNSTRAITRWHERIQLAFERVCAVLIEQSPHAMRGVLEVAMRPFHMRPPVADGARRLIPSDSIMRLMNAVATRYPSGVVLDVLEQCMRSLVPKRRWAERRHHTACIGLFLHLALEAHIPLYPTQSCNDAALVLGAAARPNANSVMRGSEESGTDGGALSTAAPRALRPLEMTTALMSASEADFSDASMPMPPTHPLPTRLAEFAMQNNKMLSYRNELIRFVLQQLLDMELSLQTGDGTTASLEVPTPATPLTPSAPLRALGQHPEEEVAQRRGDKPFEDILAACTSLVFHRLAEDLLRQQAAGVCGNAEWWRELLAFHLSSVLKMGTPFFLRYLAPSLALLGSEEEAVDMMHKLVSLVTKGYQPVQQNTWRAAAAGPARVRMAPPSVGPLIIPMTHRIRAAAYVYPLFHFMRDRLGNGEGTRKRLLKWVVQELKNNTASTPSLLVQVVFAQSAAMSHLLDANLIEEMLSQASDAKMVRSLIEKYLRPIHRSKEEGGVIAGDQLRGRELDLVKMETDGLLHPKLMDGCPWDWRRCQGGKGTE